MSTAVPVPLLGSGSPPWAKGRPEPGTGRAGPEEQKQPAPPAPPEVWRPAVARQKTQKPARIRTAAVQGPVKETATGPRSEQAERPAGRPQLRGPWQQGYWQAEAHFPAMA